MMQTLLLIALAACFALALDNGLGRTPPMGYNTWNRFGCNIDEDLIRKTADVLVSSGLAAAGYRYLNIDDCWAGGRNATTNVVYSDPKTFPSGMKALGDYIHAKGLKYGIYSDAGFKTCAGRVGSLHYEDIDAQTYASWGVDYLKYDNCNTDGSSPKIRYPPMRDALNKTGRPMFYSMCEWGVEDPATWANAVGNSWRTTGDISDNWKSVMEILDKQVDIAHLAGPGGWNDPDMLEVGNGGCTYDEYVSHFSLWAALKAPLLIGCDVTKMSRETFTILNNTEVIAINQDSLGISATRVLKDGNKEVWGGPVQRGFVAVLFNRGEFATSITIPFKTLGMSSSLALVRDLWKHQTIGTFHDAFSARVGRHSVVMIKLTPQ